MAVFIKVCDFLKGFRKYESCEFSNSVHICEISLIDLINSLTTKILYINHIGNQTFKHTSTYHEISLLYIFNRKIIIFISWIGAGVRHFQYVERASSTEEKRPNLNELALATIQIIKSLCNSHWRVLCIKILTQYNILLHGDLQMVIWLLMHLIRIKRLYQL